MKHSSRLIFRATLLAFLFSASAATLAAAPALDPALGWKLTPSPRQWTAQGFAESLDLSGIAAVGNEHCLVASDELTAVQLGRIDRRNGRIVAGAMVPLAGPAAAKGPEIDIEGVAATPDGKRYFVTGSHGVGKKKGDIQPTRFAVYEIPVNPATGEVDGARIRRASLQEWLQRSAELAPHLYRPLQMNGLNIEGLAYADGKLFFGLRGPNLKGHAHILETDARALFEGGPIECTVHRLPLGDGRGVRDLASCRDGFLVLTGNASAEPSKKFPASEAREPDARFQLAWWKPGSRPDLVMIGELPVAAGKAEALLVLEETKTHIDLLCLHDGAPEGAPAAFRLSRPALAASAQRGK